MFDVKPGQVVISTAGRDKGKYMIVYSVIDDSHVTVVNGSQRQLSDPKKKKLKHLEIVTGEVAMNLQHKLLGKMPIFDAEVRKALKPYESVVRKAAATKE